MRQWQCVVCGFIYDEAKGLPEEMVKMATEKTQRIQKAYETICKTRNIRK